MKRVKFWGCVDVFYVWNQSAFRVAGFTGYVIPFWVAVVPFPLRNRGRHAAFLGVYVVMTVAERRPVVAVSGGMNLSGKHHIVQIINRYSANFSPD